MARCGVYRDEAGSTGADSLLQQRPCRTCFETALGDWRSAAGWLGQSATTAARSGTYLASRARGVRYRPSKHSDGQGQALQGYKVLSVSGRQKRSERLRARAAGMWRQTKGGPIQSVVRAVAACRTWAVQSLFSCGGNCGTYRTGAV